MLKRLFDWLAATSGLIVLSPVLLVIALLVAITSRGPIFYRGVRAGRGGVPFRIFKFRTMVVNAEHIGGGSTGKDDPRITGFGRFLRRNKLDELPQLFNVSFGDMSLVGPRPELLQYTNQYQGDERLILSVRPGITDLASIEFIQLGDVLGNTDPDRVYEEVVKPRKNSLRVRYVREQSFIGDLSILMRTLRRLFPV